MDSLKRQQEEAKKYLHLRQENITLKDKIKNYEDELKMSHIVSSK